MKIRTYNIVLDSFTSQLPEPVIIRRGDKTGSVLIRADLQDNGIPINLTGHKVTFYGMTAGNDAIVVDPAVRITDAQQGKIEYDVNGAVAQEAGQIDTAYFEIDGGTTFDVRFVVLKSADMTAEHAKDYVSILDELIGQFEHSLDEINKRIAEIEPSVTRLEERVAEALKEFEKGNFYTREEMANKHNLISTTNMTYWRSWGGNSTGTPMAAFEISNEALSLPAGTRFTIAVDLTANPATTDGKLVFALTDPWTLLTSVNIQPGKRLVAKGTTTRPIVAGDRLVVTVDNHVGLLKLRNPVMYVGENDYGYQPSSDQLVKKTNDNVGGDNLVAEGNYFDSSFEDGTAADRRRGNWHLEGANGKLASVAHDFYHNGADPMLVVVAEKDNEVMVNSNDFGVMPGEVLSWGVGMFATSNHKDVDIFIVYDNKVWQEVFGNYHASPSTYEYLSGACIVPQGVKSAHIRIDNNGSSDSNQSSLYLAEIQVVHGSGLSGFRPSVKEFNRTNNAAGDESWGVFAGQNLDQALTASHGLKTGYVQANAINNPAGTDSMRMIWQNAANNFGVGIGITGNYEKGMYTRTDNGTVLGNWNRIAYANANGIANAFAGMVDNTLAATDLNNFRAPGAYTGKGGNSQWKNAPADVSNGRGFWGYLTVNVMDGVTFQSLYWDQSHHMVEFRRSYAGAPAAWSAWEMVYTDRVAVSNHNGNEKLPGFGYTIAPDSHWTFRRKGNNVDFYARLDVTNLNKAAGAYQAAFPTPVGYRLAQDIAGNEAAKTGVWNVPISVTHLSNPANWNGTGLVERATDANVWFAFSANGSWYCHGSWQTDDLFP